MPYKLRKAPNRNLFWVVGEDGSHKSKDPLPLERAKAQMRALYANTEKKGGADRVKNMMDELDKAFAGFSRDGDSEDEMKGYDDIPMGGPGRPRSPSPPPRPAGPPPASPTDMGIREMRRLPPISGVKRDIDGKPIERSRRIKKGGADRKAMKKLYNQTRARSIVRRIDRDVEQMKADLEHRKDNYYRLRDYIDTNPDEATEDDRRILHQLGTTINNLSNEINRLMLEAERLEREYNLFVQKNDSIQEETNSDIEGSGLKGAGPFFSRNLNRVAPAPPSPPPSPPRPPLPIRRPVRKNDEEEDEEEDEDVSPLPTPKDIHRHTKARKERKEKKKKEKKKEKMGDISLADYDFDPRIFDPDFDLDTLGRGKYKGCGALPPKNILQKIAEQSYSESPPQGLDGWNLVFQNPTLKIYQNGNTLVVGIRGTKPTDTGDLSADASIAVGQLASSNRYKNDEQTLQQFRSRFPPSQYDYYGVGHSLGGAILDLFIKKGLVKNGVSYNPAVQPQDLSSTSTQNERIYTSTDPLYQTLGRNLTVKPEVRERNVPWYEKLVSYVPWAGDAFSLYKAHTLDNFEGGRGKRGKAIRKSPQTADLVRELNSKTPWTIARSYSKAQIKKIQKTMGVPPSMITKLDMALTGGGRSWGQFLTEAYSHLSPALFNFLARKAIDDPNTDFDDLVHMIATDAQKYNANAFAIDWLQREGKELWNWLRPENKALRRGGKVSDSLSPVAPVLKGGMIGFDTNTSSPLLLRLINEFDYLGGIGGWNQGNIEEIENTLHYFHDKYGDDFQEFLQREGGIEDMDILFHELSLRNNTTQDAINGIKEWLRGYLSVVAIPAEEERLKREREGAHKIEGGKVSESLSPVAPAKFARQLQKAGIEPSAYLKEAKGRAKAHGYPYKLLGFAPDGIHKLAIPDENGRVVSFGRVGYGDHIIYSHTEGTQSVPKGTADAKRRTFQRSHSKIRGNWRNNPFSANNLALKILW